MARDGGADEEAGDDWEQDGEDDELAEFDAGVRDGPRARLMANVVPTSARAIVSDFAKRGAWRTGALPAA